MSKFKPELAAAALVEAAYTTDKEAAKKYGVTERTIRNWKKRLDNDPVFSRIFQDKRAQFEKSWADEAPDALKAGIQFLKKAAQQADPKKPDVIHSVAGAVKIIFEVLAVKQVLDVRIPTREDTE
jgi:predicted transcriptional regulator